MLDGISIIGLTPAGLLLLVVLMVLTGRLVPRATYLEKVKERDQWKAAYEVERAARFAADSQTRELLELARTGTKVLQAVHDNSEMMKSEDT